MQLVTGEFFTGKDVFVIGAGFAAAEEAIFLTRFAKKVTVIAREPEFTCSKTIADKVLLHNKIQVEFNTEIVYVKGENVLKEAKFINNQTKNTWEYRVSEQDKTFGVFVFVGYEPISEFFREHIKLNDYGYIETDEEMETNVKGVYAIGDIRPKRLRQLVTATSDGAIAATSIEKYINEKKSELDIVIENESKEKEESEEFFTEETVNQIKYVMERLQNKVKINAILLKESKLSDGIKKFLEDFTQFTDKVEIQIYNKGENLELEEKIGTRTISSYLISG